MADDDLLITAQMLSVGALAWPGRARWAVPGPLRLLAAGAVGGGALLSVVASLPHGTRLTPRVAPPQGAELHTGGPYAVSRHPIYTGLLVGGLGVAVLRRRPEPLLAWVVLAAVLDRKTRREETHLVERFGASYRTYRARTPRLLPTPRRLLLTAGHHRP
jgi:protein-S-isoprenylcysteine O-methyltransferase Ste14